MKGCVTKTTAGGGERGSENSDVKEKQPSHGWKNKGLGATAKIEGVNLLYLQ